MSKSADQKLDFLAGYGRFPYIIWKVGYALYKQIPIHFVSDKGSQLPGGKLVVANAKNTNSKALITKHQAALINMVSTVKKNMEVDKGMSQKLCLVCAPNTAFYFEKNDIKKSESIPYGGNLLSIENKLLAMATEHYLPSN